MTLTTEIFSDLMAYIKDCISYVTYVSGTESKPALINSVTLTENTVLVEIAIEESNINIREIRLYGKNGHLWAKQDIDITLGDNEAGVIYRFEINLQEVIRNV